MARVRTQMKDALAIAGLAPVRLAACPVHQALKPCEHCERIFNRAEAQKQRHDRAEGQRLHAEWIEKRRKHGATARHS